jgi:thiol-disulfide isomerase/thioredoxin
MEESFNHLFKNYFEDNKCKAFTDNDMATYNNRYYTNKKVPLLSKTPDFDLVTKDSIPYTLSKIYPENDFTLVAFYSPTCEHCQKNMPIVSDFFANLKTKYPEKKIQLIAVLNDDEEDKWDSFISEKKLTNWLNLKCTDKLKKYKEDFNAYSNPSYFLINKSGTVVLKTYNSKAIEEIIKAN